MGYLMAILKNNLGKVILMEKKGVLSFRMTVHHQLVVGFPYVLKLRRASRSLYECESVVN
jgi:hypothetical protein